MHINTHKLAQTRTNTRNTHDTRKSNLVPRILSLGITLVENKETAQKTLEQLFSLHNSDPTREFACDTEVHDIDLKHESPVGHGKIFCASIFCGDDVDFGSGPRVWINNLDSAKGVLQVFRQFFEDEKVKKVSGKLCAVYCIVLRCIVHGVQRYLLSPETL